MIVAFDAKLINSFSSNASFTVDRVRVAGGDSTPELRDLSRKSETTFMKQDQNFFFSIAFCSSQEVAVLTAWEGRHG